MSIFDRQTARVLATALVFAVGLWLLWSLREMFFLLLLGMFLAYTLEPLIRYLRGLAPRAISRRVAIVVIYVGVLLIAGSSIAWLVQTISEQAGVLIAKFPEIAKSPSTAVNLELPRQLEPFRDDILKFGVDKAQAAVSGILGSLGSAGLALLIPIFALYFLKDGPKMSGGLVTFASGMGYGFQAHRLLRDLHVLLSSYIRAVLLLSLNVFVVFAIFYQLMGVPYALLLATLAGAFEIVPVLGWLTASFLSVVIVIVSGYHDWAWLLLFYLVFRLFQDYVVTPYLMSNGVELHPLAVLAGVIGGEMVAGVPGMFLSIPLMATARLFYRRWSEGRTRSEAVDL